MYWNGDRWSRSRRPEPEPGQDAAADETESIDTVEKAVLTGLGLLVALFVGLVLTAVLALIAIALAASSMNAGL
jgi:hypothetical protein